MYLEVIDGFLAGESLMNPIKQIILIIKWGGAAFIIGILLALALHVTQVAQLEKADKAPEKE